MSDEVKIKLEIDGVETLGKLRAAVKEANKELANLPVASKEFDVLSKKIVNTKEHIGELAKSTQTATGKMMASYFRLGEEIRSAMVHQGKYISQTSVNNLVTATATTNNISQAESLKIVEMELKKANIQVNSLAAAQQRLVEIGAKVKTSLMNIQNLMMIGIGAGILGHMAEKGADAERSMASLERVFSKFGKNALVELEKVKKASAGLMDDSDIARVMVKAARLGVPIEYLAKLMEIARIKSIEFGGTVAENFELISDAIGRGTPKTLVQLGLIDRFDDSIMNMKSDLDAAGSAASGSAIKMKLLESVIRKGDEALVGFNASILDNSEKIQQIKVLYEQVQEDIGIPLMKFIISSIDYVATLTRGWLAVGYAIKSSFQYATGDWAGAIMTGQKMNENFDAMKKNIREVGDLWKGYLKDQDKNKIPLSVGGGGGDKDKGGLSDQQKKDMKYAEEFSDDLINEHREKAREDLKKQNEEYAKGKSATVKEVLRLEAERQKLEADGLKYREQKEKDIAEITKDGIKETQDLLKHYGGLVSVLQSGFNEVGSAIDSQVRTKLVQAFNGANSVAQQFFVGIISGLARIGQQIVSNIAIAGIFAALTGGGSVGFGNIFSSLTGGQFDFLGAGFQKRESGGWINEPVVGIGKNSKRGYLLGENGSEFVSSNRDVKSMMTERYSRGNNGNGIQQVHVTGQLVAKGNDLVATVAYSKMGRNTRSMSMSGRS